MNPKFHDKRCQLSFLMNYGEPAAATSCSPPPSSPPPPSPTPLPSPSSSLPPPPVRCSQDLSGSLKGRISSPFRPYPDNSRCRYTLSVEPHLQLQLDFSAAFDVEQGPDGACRDSLTVGPPTHRSLFLLKPFRRVSVELCYTGGMWPMA